MDHLDPSQEAEYETMTLLLAQLIRAGTTATVTKSTIIQSLWIALARLDNEPGPPSSPKEEKTQLTHPQFPCHQQNKGASLPRECLGRRNPGLVPHP